MFAAILDAREGGRWSIRPREPYATSRRYLPHTNVVETTFHTASGTVRLTDWLHMGARQALYRRIRGVSGSVEVEIVCDPRPDFNATGPVAFEPRLGWLVAEFGVGHRLVADGMLGPREWRMVHAGEHHCFSLALDRPGPSDLSNSLERTIVFWAKWAEDLHLPTEHPELVERSALALKGLQYQPSGAIIARRHHVASRVDRRHAQLGLPLLVAARRDPDARRARAGRQGRRSPVLARLAQDDPADLRGRGPADHVRGRR